MLSVRNSILEALPKVQPILEEILKVELGDIEVKHVIKRYPEITRMTNKLPGSEDLTRLEKFLMHCMTYPIFLITSAIPGGLCAGDSTIYYTNISLLLPKKEMEITTAHELAHIAHGRITKESIFGEGFDKLPKYIVEGFAEHTARRVMSRVYPKDKERRGTYDKYVERFREELQKRGFDEEKDLSIAIRELSTV